MVIGLPLEVTPSHKHMKVVLTAAVVSLSSNDRCLNMESVTIQDDFDVGL